MAQDDGLPYAVAHVETVIESADLQVRLFTLAAGQTIPWHFHSNVADAFIGVDGVTVVETRAPRARHELHKGEHVVVPPHTAHQVSGKDGAPCRFALTQGIGSYDFVPIGPKPA
ncbi:MAG: hypothetical protein AcusKO_23470 [Acuticoccus sp.]